MNAHLTPVRVDRVSRWRAIKEVVHLQRRNRYDFVVDSGDATKDVLYSCPGVEKERSGVVDLRKPYA
jgi:hypothetical protein